MNILNIDLDFFLYGRKANYKRPRNEIDIEPWSKKKVIDFLEIELGLSKKRKVLGCCLNHHHEVYFKWKKLIEMNLLNTPFNIYHIDAHSDLGNNDPIWKKLTSKIVKLPLKERVLACKDDLTCNNYLSIAIANRWLNSLIFIKNENWYIDLAPYLLTEKSFEDYKNYNRKISSCDFELEIKYLDYNLYHEDFYSVAKSVGEPIIPFKIIDIKKLKGIYNKTKWDYIYLANSPDYTPESADYLMEVIKEYIDLPKYKNLAGFSQ